MNESEVVHETRAQELQSISVDGEVLQQLSSLYSVGDGVEQMPQVCMFLLNEDGTLNYVALPEAQNDNVNETIIPVVPSMPLLIGDTSISEIEQQLQDNPTADDDEDVQEPQNKFRRRFSRPQNWKRNKAKVYRETGQQYVNVSGKTVLARKVQESKHSVTCRMNCENKITADDRQLIHEDFWTLTESQKRDYFARTTHRESKKRTRSGRAHRTDKIRNRVYAYKYYFVVRDVRIQVCKSYYLTTLDISNNRLNTYYATRNPTSGTPSQRKQGRHVKKRIADEHRNAVRDHINCFPRIESHYCRATTSRQYLDPALSVSRMYDMFVESRLKQNRGNPAYVEPVKKHLYETVFNTEFNLAFHVPKKDRCDTCEAFSHASDKSQKVVDDHQIHIAAKENTTEERNADRKLSDNSQAVLCFDLQNVITLPRANISSFFTGGS